jgi:hypothetical protein
VTTARSRNKEGRVKVARVKVARRDFISLFYSVESFIKVFARNTNESSGIVFLYCIEPGLGEVSDSALPRSVDSITKSEQACVWTLTGLSALSPALPPSACATG